jgi:hypothetical protein
VHGRFCISPGIFGGLYLSSSFYDPFSYFSRSVQGCGRIPGIFYKLSPCRRRYPFSHRTLGGSLLLFLGVLPIRSFFPSFTPPFPPGRKSLYYLQIDNLKQISSVFQRYAAYLPGTPWPCSVPQKCSPINLIPQKRWSWGIRVSKFIWAIVGLVLGAFWGALMKSIAFNFPIQVCCLMGPDLYSW